MSQGFASKSIWNLDLTYVLPSGKPLCHHTMTFLDPSRSAGVTWWILYDSGNPERALLLNEVLSTIRLTEDGRVEARIAGIFGKLFPALVILGAGFCAALV